MAAGRQGYLDRVMKGMQRLLMGLVLSFILHPSALRAGETGSIHYLLDVSLSDSDLKLETPARVKIELPAPDLTAESCLYFGLLDPLQARSQALLAVGKPPAIDKASRQIGEIQNFQSSDFEAISPFLYRLKGPPAAGVVLFSYDILLPGWKDRSAEQRLLTQFYPQVLTRCPADGEEAMFIAQRRADFRVKINHPSSWSLLAPGTAEAGIWSYSGREFSAVLYKKGQVKETRVGSDRFYILSSSSNFHDLELPAAKAIELYSRLTGLPPEKDLIIVETDDFEPFNASGLIALNKPQQKMMQMLQEEYLHWNVWQLSRALAEQWFGLAIKPASLDDYWLVQGFADDMMLQHVESERLLSNLFIGDKGEEAYLQFHFRQAQDLQAALLSLNYPINGLIDANLQSRKLTGLSAPFNFIRHSQALRYLRWYLREPAYGNWIKRLVQRFAQENMSPRAVLETLESEVHRPRARHDLQRFWESDSWPNLAVGEVEKDLEKGGSRLEIRQLSSLWVAADVSIKTKTGVLYNQEVAGDAEVSFIHLDSDPSDIDEIQIDSQRAIFDSDRYNNSDRIPQLTLFPGSARTLRDDAYTVLWVPLASKLPGQSLSLQLNWQVLRYIGSGLSGMFYYFPDRGAFGLRAAYNHNIPDLALAATFSIADSDGNTAPGERLWDLRLQRSPLLKNLDSISAESRLRFRQIIGDPDSNHISSALALAYRTDKLDVCSYEMKVEYEASTWVPKGDFGYARSSAISKIGCEMPWLQLRLRGFMGSVRVDGEAPGGALFLPQNLGEARIRLDSPKLPAALKIRSANFDLSLPARLPLPDSFFVLPRRSTFKAYSDWALMHDPNTSAHVAGVGYALPFGGDVVGKSSITLLQLALYTVLYRRLGDSTDTKPGILFDLGGEL